MFINYRYKPTVNSAKQQYICNTA